MVKLKLEEIEKKIKEKNAHWIAKENHISIMSETDQKKLLGAIPPIYKTTTTTDEIKK